MTVDLNYYKNIKYLVLMSINSNKNKYWADDDFGSDLFKLNKAKIEKSTLIKKHREQKLLQCYNQYV